MGERILVDTDIFIDYYKSRLDLPLGNIYFISVISLYEYIRGTKNPQLAKKLLEESFTIIPLTNSILVKASEIWRNLRKKAMIIDDRDLIIGTTAIVFDLKLLTKNVKHFSRLKDYGLEFYYL